MKHTAVPGTQRPPTARQIGRLRLLPSTGCGEIVSEIKGVQQEMDGMYLRLKQGGDETLLVGLIEEAR